MRHAEPCVVASHAVAYLGCIALGPPAWWRKTGDAMRRRLAAFCVLALCLASVPALAAGPGWKLAGTYPDTGGRAPVAHGGKVLPPGSSPASVLAACSGDIDRICAGRSGLYAARACL